MAEQIFDRLDTNGDDVITPDEIPDRFKPMLALAGLPADARITREEFMKRAGELINQFGRKKGPTPKKTEEVATAKAHGRTAVGFGRAEQCTVAPPGARTDGHGSR